MYLQKVWSRNEIRKTTGNILLQQTSTMMICYFPNSARERYDLDFTPTVPANISVQFIGNLS